MSHNCSRHIKHSVNITRLFSLTETSTVMQKSSLSPRLPSSVALRKRNILLQAPQFCDQKTNEQL
jgi:hypothetical protein